MSVLNLSIWNYFCSNFTSFEEVSQMCIIWGLTAIINQSRKFSGAKSSIHPQHYGRFERFHQKNVVPSVSILSNLRIFNWLHSFTIWGLSLITISRLQITFSNCIKYHEIFVNCQKIVKLMLIDYLFYIQCSH